MEREGSETTLVARQLPMQLSRMETQMFQKFVFAMVVIVTMSGILADLAQGRQLEPKPATAAAATTRFSSVDDAVAAGVVDRDVVETLKRDGVVRAMVAFKADPLADKVAERNHGSRNADLSLSDLVELTREMRKHRMALLDGIEGVKVVETFRNLPNAYVEFVSAEAILEVANRSTVTAIQASLQIEAADAESLKLIRRNVGSAQGRTGSGVDIVVLDTGLELANVGCTANLTPSTCRYASYEVLANDDGRQDDHGHGTNVSAIVGAVAPGARVLTFDVFRWDPIEKEHLSAEREVTAQIDTIIDWKTQSGLNIRAVNMSLGQYDRARCANSAFYGEAFKRLRAADILPIVSAGNDEKTGGVGYPACLPGAVSVGAVYDADQTRGFSYESGCTDSIVRVNKVTCFSNSGNDLDMLAPGAPITAGGHTMNGTSQAAPHVAGAVAVLAAAKPSANADAIEKALISSGPWIKDHRTGRFHRRLDLPSAVDALIGATTDTQDPVPSMPLQSLRPDTALDASRGTTVRIKWSATDNVGVTGYRLQASTNGAAWTNQVLPSPTVTEIDYVLAAGSSYTFRIQARDAAGNWSGWATGPAFRMRVVGEQSTGATYSNGWQVMPWDPAIGGKLAASATAGASASFKFTGTDIGLIAARDATGGTADILVDGRFAATIDLSHAEGQARFLAFGTGWRSAGQHTIEIRVHGTAGRPNVWIDGFVVIETA